MERRISVGIFQPKYVDHLQRWSRIFRSEETETNLSIWISTEISGIFGIMESTLILIRYRRCHRPMMLWNGLLYSYFEPKSLSLHHGRLPDGLLSFRITGHCKYLFLCDPSVIRVAIEIRETDLLVLRRGCFPTWPYFRKRRHLEFLIRLVIGLN